MVSVSLSYFLGTDDIATFLAYKLMEVPAGIRHDPFYHAMFTLWIEAHGYAPVDEDDVRREIIWGNRRITAAGKPIFKRNWAAAGIRSIQDICHPSENRLLSHSELSEKFGVQSSFIDMLGLRLSIPLEWRRMLTNNYSPPPDPASLTGIRVSLPNEQPSDVATMVPKRLYSALISSRKHCSTAFTRWSDHSDPSLKISGHEEWRDICLSVYRATRETKIQSLHFRVINRIVPCGKFLKQVRLVDSDLCALCDEQDSLTHFFYDCPYVGRFWASVCQWFDGVEDLHLGEISAKHFLLGLPPLTPNSRKINTILMSVKFFIYRQRLFHHGRLDLLHWLMEFRSRLRVERDVLVRESRATRFATWNRIFMALG